MNYLCCFSHYPCPPRRPPWRPLPGLPGTRHYESSRETFSSPDRTITWRALEKGLWRAEFRVRTGDRYLGHGQWEHCLGFEEHASERQTNRALAHSSGRETVLDVMIAPARRYAIVKITMADRSLNAPESKSWWPGAATSARLCLPYSFCTVTSSETPGEYLGSCP